MIKKCPVCGKDFETPYITRKYCSDECYRKKDRQRSRDYQSPYMKKKVDQSVGNPVKTLDDWIREAADCNLDYGTYRALRSAGKSFEEIKTRFGGRSLCTHSHCHSFKESRS